MQSEGWWCGNPSGRRPNFIGRQHLTFDKGGKFSADVKAYRHIQMLALRKVSGIVRFWRGWCEARSVKYFNALAFNNNRLIDRVRPHL